MGERLLRQVVNTVDPINPRLDHQTMLTRKKWRGHLGHFIKSETVPTPQSGLQEALQHVRNGGSLIVYSRHRSRVDPIAVMFEIYDADPTMKDIPIIYPIGKHQQYLLGVDVAEVAKHLGISVNPIVTEGTLKKWKKKIDKGGSLLSKLGPFQIPLEVKSYMKRQLPTENTGFAEFSNAVETGFKKGPVVLYLPTQSQRSPLLNDVRQGERTLGNIAALVKRRRIKNLGVLFVDVSTEKGDQHPTQKGGLDLFQVNKVRFGPFYTLENALELAGNDIKKLDEWAIRDVMTKLVPVRHFSFELSSVLKERNP